MTDELFGYGSWENVRAWLAGGRDAWRELDDGQLADLHFLVCAETERPEGLRPGLPHELLYEYLVERTPLEARWRILGSTQRALLGRPGLVAPLYPFLLLEDDLQLAAAAATALVDVWSPATDDPLEPVRAVAGVGFRAPAPPARAATIAMLVGYADARLRSLWLDRWRSLPSHLKHELAQTVGANPTLEAVEFLLCWLERGPAEDFGSVAGSLAHIAACGGPLLEARRDFTARGRVLAEPEIVARWSVEDWGREIAPRIRALTATEEGPSYVMPWVAQAWGVDVSDLAPTGEDWVREAG